ncbi:MAG: CinA family nicotinamide mononucleotide deamidase-related protein [Planctomycetota bacterium]|jgi:nicotinamide-nucleotide amidase
MKPKSFIIASGAELLRGEVEDRNSPFLARGLALLGYPVAAVHWIPDDEAALRASLDEARKAGAGVAVVSGGLGPTEDDRTREGIAAFAGVPLSEHPGLASAVHAFLKARRRRATPGALRQALLPEKAEPMDNPRGTAAGFFLDAAGMRVIALPGPPAELRATAGEDLQALAKALPHGGEGVSVLRLDSFGFAEAEVDPLLQEARAVEGITVGTLAGGGAVGVVLCARGPNRDQALAEARRAVESRLGDRIYGEGGETLAGALVRRLSEAGVTLATAESCTGGLLGHMLTQVPGVSSVFLEGQVAYSNAVKVNRLGVPSELLEGEGAVSGEVAAAMARGVAEGAGAAMGIGITGIAGPGGGTASKPVGLVYIAVSTGGREEVRRLMLGGLDRGWVKRLSALSALDLARRMIS